MTNDRVAFPTAAGLVSTSPAIRPSVAFSDEELMRRLQADDVPAFEELYDRYSAEAFALARFICGGSRRAEDAAQDGFLTVWRSRRNYDPARSSPRTWLLTVVRHRSIDLMRRDGRAERLLESDCQLRYLPAPGSVTQDAERQDEANRLKASLRELPMLQREVIALAYFGGLTHAEIAARLKLPTGTVKGRLRLGLDKLRVETQPVP